SGRLIHVLEGHSAEVSRGAFAPDGALVATASHDGTVRLWDVATGAVLGVVARHPAGVMSATFDGAGGRLLTGSLDGTAKLWPLPRVGPSTDFLDAITRCRVPYRVQEGQLVRVVADPAACPPQNLP